MSVPFGPAVLTVDDLTRQIRRTFEQFTDPRRGKNARYTLVDAGLSAFSVFFMPSPSFLEYQRSLNPRLGKNNAQTLFGVHDLPADNQSRHLLDAPEPGRVKPLFSYIFHALNQAGVVETYRSVNPTLLLAFEGPEYFSSPTIQCPQCSTRQHANDTVTSCHTALTPVLVKPGLDPVIPLAPEFVRPQDGAEQQDCELNAAKRWLADWGDDYRPLGITVLGDDLYCHEPFCREVLKRRMDFILVCKPASHAIVYEGLELLQRGGAVHTGGRRRWTGRRREIDTYRYATAIPLRDGDDPLGVNWGELTTTDEHGKGLYHHAFATSLALNEPQVLEVVAAGRCRWQIENENHHTLKTKGYPFEHHYGHGQQQLSAWLASLLILAFLVQTVLEWMDDHYQLRRQKLPSRQRLFSDIRTLTRYLGFESGGALMTFMLQSFESAPPQRETG